MSRNGSSEPEQHLPLFLADEAEERGIGNALSRAVISSRVLKALAWAAVPVALGIAVLSVEAPAKLISDLTASVSGAAGSLLGHSALQPETDRAAPVIRYAAADAQGLPPATVDTLAREDLAIEPEPDHRRAETAEPPSEALLSQFQAWAADKPAQAPSEPVASVPDAPVPVAQEAPLPIAKEAVAKETVAKEAREETREPTRTVQKRRQGKALHNARAEMRPAHLRRKKVSQEQYSRVPDRPAQETRVPEQGQVAQPAQAPAFQTAPSFFQTLGIGTQQQ
ncbi:MAG: hypothetical protein ABW175_05035 [Bradyrhizobium sp.]